MVEYHVKYRGEIVHIFSPTPLKAGDLLRKFQLSPVYAFVVSNGEVVEESFLLSTDASLEVINAISGG